MRLGVIEGWMVWGCWLVRRKEERVVDEAGNIPNGVNDNNDGMKATGPYSMAQ